MNESSEVMLLVQEIKAAFADVPYPGDDNIADPANGGDEGVSDYFRGTTQEGHTVTNLGCHSCALSFFFPEAYHYWLPTFAIAVLEDPEEADIIYDSLICDFNFRGAAKKAQRLSTAQRQAMIKYFELCLSREGEYIDDGIAYAVNILKKKHNPWFARLQRLKPIYWW